MELADTTRIEVARLRERLPEVRNRPAPVPQADHRARGRGSSEASVRPELEAPEHAVGLPPLPQGAEREAIRFMVHKPEVAGPLLDASLFTHPTARAAYDLLESNPNLAEAISDAAPELAEELTRLSVEDLEVDATDVLSRLATEIARMELIDMEMEARNSDDPLEYSDAIGYLKVTLDELRRPFVEGETVIELLDWLKLRRSEGE